MEEKTKSGKNASVFKDVSIYAKIEDPVTDQTKKSSETTYTYYVDKSAFKEGDAIVNQETGERYIIGETDTLEGVYCINKGYAVFRKIVMIEQNDEYCIVETGTTYGLSQFDYIVRNGNTVKEDDILFK